MKIISKIKLKVLISFIKRRRNSALLEIRSNETFTDKFIFWFINRFLKNNSKFEKIWKSDFSDYYVGIFLFRKFDNLMKYEQSRKLTFVENPIEKPTLLGEALGYPDFAIKDFTELRQKWQDGDRLSIKCFDWGYDGLVFKKENFSKMKKWLEDNKIPLKKVIILDNETGKWRKRPFKEYESSN